MNPHFGNVGDVCKHMALCELLVVRPPTTYVETHAGAPWYPWTALPHRPANLREALTRPGPRVVLDLPARAARARGQVAGSTHCAATLTPWWVRMTLCETRPDTAAQLRAHFADEERVRVVEGDGCDWVCAHPGAHGRCVVIDPFRLDDRHDGGPSAREAAWILAERGERCLVWWPRVAHDDPPAGDGLPAGVELQLECARAGAGLAGCGVRVIGAQAAERVALERVATTLGSVRGLHAWVSAPDDLLDD